MTIDFAYETQDWQLNVRQNCCQKKELQWLADQYVSHEANKTTIEFYRLSMPKHDIQPHKRIVKLCFPSWIANKLMNHQEKCRSQ